MDEIFKAKRLKIYINPEKKSAEEIREEVGCDYDINLALFETKTYKPVGNLKADGVVINQQWGADKGFYWSGTEPLQYGWTDMTSADNFFSCVRMIEDGKPIVPLEYNKEMGGERQRTAFGVTEDGRIWMYADKVNQMTPEELQAFAATKGLKHALMMDGGLSTQGAGPNGAVKGGRPAYSHLCAWAEEDNSEGGDTMFKIALGAGHGVKTAGKRCLKSIDPNETREWVLNDRICDYIEKYLKDYEGYQLLRLDDSDDGSEDVALATRVNKANSWGADYYLSIHHNAGINGGKGGGIVAYSYPNSKAGAEWRNEFYDALIAKTGLKGNRATPKTTANFYVLKYTKMAAGLLELGFMDSKVDTPVILTEEFAQNCAKAIVEVIARRGKLTRKKAVEEKAGLWRVQVGAFSSKAAADNYAAELKKKGYEAYVTSD